MKMFLSVMWHRLQAQGLTPVGLHMCMPILCPAGLEKFDVTGTVFEELILGLINTFTWVNE